MIQVEDLMIGDWIYVAHQHSNMDGDYDLIFEAEILTLKHFKFWADNHWDKLDFEEFLKPIPLTAEILEKNGFKSYIPENHLETVYACQDVSKAVANELYALWPYQDGSFYLLLRVDGKDMVRMNIHYVHQLQHTLKLCGIEKEIKL